MAEKKVIRLTVKTDANGDKTMTVPVKALVNMVISARNGWLDGMMGWGFATFGWFAVLAVSLYQFPQQVGLATVFLIASLWGVINFFASKRQWRKIPEPPPNIEL